MALKDGTTYYTKFSLVGHGEVVNRRIHRLEVQGRNGHLEYCEGEDLPDFIELKERTPVRGKHIATLLGLNLEAPKYTVRLPADSWPSRRDLVHVIVGLVVLMFVKVAIAWASGDF
jgi:hypothetical protein